MSPSRASVCFVHSGLLQKHGGQFCEEEPLPIGEQPPGLKSEANAEVFKLAFFLTASRGRLLRLQNKSDCIEVYEKMSLLLT